MFISKAAAFSLTEWVNRIRNRLKSPPKIPPDTERSLASLPPEGNSVSVETVLNSRCTSDYDDAPELFHWGMFDKIKKLSPEQLLKIKKKCGIPRFTDKRIEIRIDKNAFTVIVDRGLSDTERQWVMVEAGMLQQAVCLCCAALGVGMVFKNKGKDGTPISEKDRAVIKMKLDAMKPSYEKSFWTNSAPRGRKPWLQGSLPEPLRSGNMPFIDVLRNLEIKNDGSAKASRHSVSQLLWAAKGRTPHLYKSREWGMTIPSWGGDQNVSGIFFFNRDAVLYKYLNWKGNRPTHHLEELQSLDKNILKFIDNHYSFYDSFILLGKNESFARADWEIGYQFLNLMVQAAAWNLSYEAVLLTLENKDMFKNINIQDPVALFAFTK